MDGVKNLVPLLPLLLPMVGKLLLMIPFVPNKLIPFVNAAIATAAKFWFLAGFGPFGPVPVPGTTGSLDDHPALAGFFGELGRAGLSIAWGCMDAAAAHYFYEGKRAIAAKVGRTSWWEEGKQSLYGKQMKSKKD